MANNSSVVSIDYVSLKSCNNAIINEIEKFRGNIDRLRSSGTFPKSEWNDASADTFNSAMETYISYLNGLYESFAKITSYLNKKCDDYKSLDRMN